MMMIDRLLLENETRQLSGSILSYLGMQHADP